MLVSVALSAQTVVDVIVNSPDHTTLETAVIAAELDDDLSAAGPFTVFAPTDAAFDALPAGALDALLADPTGALADVLLYHVVSGNILSTDLSDGQMAPTLLGPDVTVSIDGGGNVMINNAMVTVADITADNGVVHVIDAVLLPPTTTVVDVIVNSPDHETLETAVIAAELDDDLSGDGPFTVFAPTDAAFDALPAGALDDLLADPTGALAEVLLYHVAAGNVMSGDLSDGQMIETLLGPDVTVTIDGGGNVMINNAMVTVADIPADNGVVHVIDAVLLPPTTTVVDVIVNSPDHETLETAVIAAELDDDLSGDGPFTVFAPTDAAFDALPAGALDDLLADPTGALAEVLLYHVAAGNVMSGDLSDGQMIETLLGPDVTVTIDGGGNVMINNAMVTVADIPADNGVVHVIDAVLLPPTTTVVDVIVNSPDHETLETAVIAAELDDDLSGDGPFTVFAPTDAAFDALPAGALDDLLADPTGALAEVLLYHVAAGNVMSGDLSDGQMIETLLGPDVTVTIDGGGNVMINNAMVTVADIPADNGVVHVIDAVLLPPALPATVVDIIVDSEDHNTLETAVIAAELDDDLSAEGPFTVFAPTDAAFDALPAGALDDLLADPTGALADVLLYHVAAGNVMSTDLSDGQMITTLFGADVEVSIDMGGVIMINDAIVTVADIEAENGVVHVIDAVLLPPSQPATVVDIIVDSEVHNTLETAVIAAELDDDLSAEGPFTVFAPTDAAFDALPAGVLDDLLDDPTGALADILLYHVAAGNVMSGDLSDGQMITTLLGQDVEVTIDGGGNVMINDAMVTIADITADNGVVHVIDAVLLPEVETTTVVDIIVDSPDHNTLETAVIAAELDDDLSGEGPFTVFAPTDAAFDALPAGALDDLLADPTGALAEVLLYHVIGQEILSGDLSDGASVTTLQGEDVTVSIDGSTVMINDAMVTVVDLVADNGVVHVIDAVLLPPVSVAENNLNGVEMYPNPAFDVLNLRGEVPAGTEVQIIDQTGRVVMTTSFNGVATIDVSALEAGMYNLVFNANNAIAAKQFIVK
jgi:uncharacterized surface protein with fasciclin (FAS1) repeats